MKYIFSNLSKTELVVIVILALLLFGGKKIPEFMKGLGTGLKEFNKAIKIKDNDNDNDNNDFIKKND
ncbi:Sec-independent protein translocase subunit TatA/TatB [Candidatus Shikimatogenerans silvanidophilus]|uniref:Sec-independent protein translocase subunit TatA/TatB n=1 Tax=Candidatus Shikimatogenerans silvanidophilus TaxID=2782547 RepID=UPI001BAB9803|nr:twin-arginine translocase TatA/TatE family subunit [Candidatus Shikimatogenerans silvanidophilus]